MLCWSKRLFFAVVVSAVTTSCGEVAPQLANSGSSNFGFARYFIEPINDSVIAIDENSVSKNTILSSTSIQSTYQPTLSASDVRTGLSTQDTSATIFSTSYCTYFASSFSEKISTEWLVNSAESTTDPNAVPSAAFISEKAYLEAMKNYCYARETFSLTGTEVQSETSPIHGEVRWFRNASTYLGSRTFDYLISQSRKQTDTHLFTKFKESGTVGQEHYSGILRFAENDKDDKDIELYRYFVDDSTKTNMIPASLRWEGYAVKEKSINGKVVHYIASNIIDFFADRLSSSSIGQDSLVIQKSQFITLEGVGSKQVYSEYCYYDIDDPTPTLVDMTKESYFTANLNSCGEAPSDKKHSTVQASYYNADGILVSPDNSADISRQFAQVEDQVDLQAMLDALQPDDAGNSLGTYSREDVLRVNTSSPNAYLDF